MDNRRRADGRVRSALIASLALHVAIVTFAVVAEGSPPKPPKTKVYAVDIVSPPPNMAGEMPAEPPATQEPGPAASAEPAPTPAETAPEPTPPAPEPDPEPAPPRREAPKEPEKAPEPRRTPPAQRPAPEQPKQRPSTTPTRPSMPAASTNRPASSTTRPATDRPTSGSSGQSGTGSGPNRTQGTGTRTGPATGSNPDANSPGGEGLVIRQAGEDCPVAGFCENVTRQVRRFFRPPPESTGGRGEVCFRIRRDGSITTPETRNVRGNTAFRFAMMEAAENAGSRRAFGTLPSAFDPALTSWCVELAPN